MKCTIELKNVGRSKVNRTVETKADNLTTAEYLAVKEAAKYLMSQDISISLKENKDYQIFAGVRPVGIATITLMPEGSSLN